MNWRIVALLPNSSLEAALRMLDRTAMQIILVVNKLDHLLGTLTDGDIRRALLKGARLSDEIALFMNSNPVTAPPGSFDSDLLDMIRRLGIKCVPIVNSVNEICDLALLENLIDVKPRLNPVLIMAGGRGERLKPLTDSTPKPLLTIAGQPLIEILLKRLSSQGFRKIWIAVHYRAEDIVNAIGDGKELDLEIQFLREKIPLGTAGALKLLPEFDPPVPILVCNSDLMNGADFGAIVDHHVSKSAVATMAVSQHLTEIPYGVAHVEGGKLVSLEEKPMRKDLISAGINVFDSRVVSQLPGGQKLDIPDVYSKLMAQEESVVVYELQGYWLDVGTVNSMKQAENDHTNH